jgi:colanic acid/amylovoran biosynthesis glycosyltransferase
MSRPQVMYLLRYYPTLTETFVQDEIEGMLQVGIGVRIAAMGSREDGALARDLPAAPVLAIPRRPLTGRLARSTPGMRWLASQQRPKDAARLPWLAARAAEVDLVHVHFAGEAAEWACALRRDGGPPYTVTVHAADLFKPRPSLDTVLSEAEVVFTVAEHHAALLRARGHAPVIARCGPVLDRWQLPPAPPGPLRALFIGRDVPKKGLDVLLDAWAPAPGDRLTLLSDRHVGSIPTIRSPGLQPRGAVRTHMAQSNLVVLPCRRAADGDLDGVPVALMEALAAGRPVISTRVSGIPELVDDGVGWLVPADDAHALARALEAARDPEERTRRGAAGPGRLRARGFTRASQVSQVLAAWGHVPSLRTCRWPQNRP